MITSTHNPKIQWVRSLQAKARQRREAQALVIEGVRLAEEALAAGWEAQLVLYTEDLAGRGLEVVEGFAARQAPIEKVSEHVFQAASDTQAPQCILAVLSVPEPAPFDQLDFVFIPDQIRDPGNLGAILRSAAAAGVQAVFLPPGTVDHLAPKVVRSAMGAHFRLAILPLSWEEIEVQVKQFGLYVYLAAINEGQSYTRAGFQRPLALIIGGEAEGAGQQAEYLAQQKVHIPMPGGSESLNAASAAAILLFEIVRQREPTTRNFV